MKNMKGTKTISLMASSKPNVGGREKTSKEKLFGDIMPQGNVRGKISYGRKTAGNDVESKYTCNHYMTQKLAFSACKHSVKKVSQ